MAHDVYENPLITRYASKEMAELFGMRKRISTWRRLWIALAEAERTLGLPVTKKQIDEMKRYVDDIDWKTAEKREREVRHDVMAHVHAFGAQATSAAPVIHLGATSCFVTDNADLVLMREGLRLLCEKAADVIDRLGAFAKKHASLPTLAFTHMQPAQPTTVGKRATLWILDLLTDLDDLERLASETPFRGVKGTTGTQASFLALFEGDHAKVERLDELVRKAMDFDRSLPVTGQTYTRKIDSRILAALAGVGESAHKFGTDIRLLAHRKEMEEPFGKKQIGSSAMAYKRNPMRSERLCSLSRFLMTMPANAWATHATQWMERTLDDSANRRLSLPQSFLAADAILELQADIADGLVVYPKVIEKNLRAELPFMATENILMAAVRAGGDRQELHEVIRGHSVEAARRVKEDGAENDLLDRLAGDPAFSAVLDRKALADALDPKRYVGRAPEQTKAFLKDHVTPVRRRYRRRRSAGSAVRV